jgi:molybdopterin-biosynthesis enzyme MoeA-like protein
MDDLTMEQIAAYAGRSLATFKRDFAKISTLNPQKWSVKSGWNRRMSKLKEEGKRCRMYTLK